MKELILIQNELKAPKNLYNSFGKYKYRNTESILEGVKPLLKKYNCTLTISDDVIECGGKNYIKTSALLTNEEGDAVKVSALAQEDSHKGMSADQCTGTASSYARKYCLNGLFLIDDTKDADTDEFKEEATAKAKKLKDDAKKISDADASNIKRMLELSESDVPKFLTYFNVKCVEDMTEGQLEEANNMLTRKIGGKK